jgi:hypothetical protein
MRRERLALYPNNGFPAPIDGWRYHGLFHHPTQAAQIVILALSERKEK